MTAVTEIPTQVVADAEKTHEERFKWRAWVHHPEGAVACENATNGKCRDDDHFHALCRLPNPYQQNDIVEKAQAARARRLRMLRDEESDPRVILEDQLDGLKGVPQEIVVDELVDFNFTEDYTAALREVEGRLDPDYVPEGDEDIPKLYENIDQDREEYMRQRDLPEDQRGDDWDELEKTYSRYSIDVQEELKRVQEPQREHLMSLDIGELIDMIRRRRMEEQGTQAYLQAYMMWQMYIGTYKPVAKGNPGERIWDDINAMRNGTDAETIVAVKTAFDYLDTQAARTRQGKDS